MIPKKVKFNQIRRRLKDYKIYWNSSRGKGSHGVFLGPDSEGQIQSYPIPRNQQREIERIYLTTLLKRFGINPDEFFSVV